MNAFLESQRLCLCPITEEYCTPEYLSWLHNKEVNRYLETGIFPLTLPDLTAFVKSIDRKNSLFFAIVIKENKKHIGNIKIDQISWIHGRGEYGILIGDTNEWGKGYAKEASQLIIDYCFEKLNLRKVTLGVLAENKEAVDLYKKLNFQQEGYYKEHSFHDGRFMDVIRMAIFKNEKSE